MWITHVLHGAYGRAQKSTDCDLDKLLKAIYSTFKLSPARREDYLKVNELLESHESKGVAYLFPKKFCGHRWLVNVDSKMLLVKVLWTQVASKREILEKGHRVTYLL